MSASRLAYTFTGTFVTAVFLLQWWERAAYPLWLWLALCALGLLRALPVALGLSFALLTVSLHTHVASPLTIDAYADGRTVTVTGTVVDAADRRASVTRYTVAVESLHHAQVHGRLLVRDFGGWPRFERGDVVTVTGKLTRPEPMEDFAYDRYLALSDIHAEVTGGRIERLNAGTGYAILPLLSQLRGWFEGRINELYPEPAASFLAGLLTGSRRDIPKHVTRDLERTGLSHVIAISGYNITMVITMIGALLGFLPRRPRILLTTIAIILYVLLAGASASAVRAAIMGILGLVALQTGRLADRRLTVLWAAFLMLLWNPAFLWDDAGFQLSFLAVIGLIEAEPVLRPMLKRVPEALGFRDALLMTLSAQVFTVPWIAVHFGRIALISPLSNVLAGPLIPAATLLGFVGTLLSLLLFPLGQIVAYGAWFCMALILGIASLFARLPFATIETGPVSSAILFAVYAAIVALLVRLQRYTKSGVVLPSHGTRSSFSGFLSGKPKDRQTMTVPGFSSRSNFGMSRATSPGMR